MIKEELKVAQNVVNDHVYLAKAALSTHQEIIIHSMRVTPIEAWARVKILAGGMTSHHKKPTVMHLRLTNSEIATNDAKKASVMGPHLEKVYRNHRPVYWSALQGLLQQTSMLELGTLISWEEVKQALTNLSNEKSPGLNDVPADAFKALDNQNLLTLLDFFNSY